VPVAATAFLLHPPLQAIRRGAHAALIVAQPIAGWTARNVAVGLSSLLPAPLVLPDNLPAPYGYVLWGATWMSEEYQRMGWGAPITRLKYRNIEIDDRAFDNPAERDRVKGWLAELAQFEDQPFPPEIDARFAALARERAANAPVRTYLLLPALRARALWSNPFSSFGWPNELPALGYQERVEAARSLTRLLDVVKTYPMQAASKTFTAGYRFVLLIAFVIMLAFSFGPRLGETRKIIWIAATWVVARTLFFALTNSVETRYTLQLVPTLEIAVALGILALFAPHRKVRAPEHETVSAGMR
jgi:hypothetical protein